MDPGGATSEKPASREEAAGWLALLHSDDRTPGDEAAFRAWLRRHAWFGSKRRLLTYRRDDRGRFRRYRR